MKKYNIDNYLRYKQDLKQCLSNIENKSYEEYTGDQLITVFIPLVENIARKFSTADQASGIMDITDLIQEGCGGLVQAVGKIEWDKINDSNSPEQTLKSFLSKRIKGSIRRAIDINRGSIRIPEHKLNEIRNNPENTKIVEMFFNSIFQSLDEDSNVTDDNFFDQENYYTKAIFEDKSTEYNIDLLNAYLFSLFKKHLTHNESEVLRLSYGLDCDKHSAISIAEILDFKGPSAYVRISELKKFAISKLIANVEPSQVVDYL